MVFSLSVRTKIERFPGLFHAFRSGGPPGSDSGEWYEVKKGREKIKALTLSLLRTALRYLNAWNRLAISTKFKILAFKTVYFICQV